MHLFFLPKFYRDLKKVLAFEFVTDYNPSVIIILLLNVQKNVYWEWRISMKKIVIVVQIDKNEVKDLVEKFSEGQFEIDIKSDLDAAMAVKSGQADYYVGACNTGGGGALAMALALLGRENCVTVSMPGNECLKQKSVRMYNQVKLPLALQLSIKKRLYRSSWMS